MLDAKKCDKARRTGTKIICTARDGELCGHVYYCGMRGVWELSEMARTCPAKERKQDGENNKADQN